MNSEDDCLAKTLESIRKADEYCSKELECPYPEVLAFINKHSHSGTACRLAKFALSLYDAQQCFSLAECAAANDYNVNELMSRCVDYYLRKGETEDLRILGRAVIVRYRMPENAEVGGIFEVTGFFKKRLTRTEKRLAKLVQNTTEHASKEAYEERQEELRLKRKGG